jgi:hypothetical protein
VILQRPRGLRHEERGLAVSPASASAERAAAILAALMLGFAGAAGAQSAPEPEIRAGGSAESAQASQAAGSGSSVKRPSPASAKAKYVDQLIDESLEGEDDGLSLEEREGGAEPLGRRLYAAEARHFQRRSADSRFSENGLLLQHRRETLDYGELSLDVQGRNAHESNGALVYGGSGSGAQFQFRQFRHPLTSNFLMDNSVGAVRLGPNSLIGSSYRVQLPSTLANGVQSVTYRDEREFRVYSGRVGRLVGSATHDFEETSGEVLGLGYKQAIARGWSVGTQVIDFKNGGLTPEHRSIALALRFEDKPAGRQFSVHGLGGNQGGKGVWVDGVESAGLWQHRYGAYRLPLSLYWADANIGSDAQGVYARSEYRTGINSVALGAEVAEANLDDDPTRSGAYTRSAYSTLYHRVSRDTSLNGSVSVTDRTAKAALAAAEDSTSTSVSAGLAQRFEIGQSNFRIFAGKTSSPTSPARNHGATWDHAWNVRGWQLSTALSYQKDDAAGIATERKGAAANFRAALTGTAALDGGIQYTRSQSDIAGDSDNVSGNLNVNWTLSRHWSSRLQLLWNRAETASTVGSAPVIQDKSIFIALRGEDSSGRPYMQLGRATGEVGSGRIVGWVFFDDNNDGVRQASERPAAGVIVYLDGRYSVTTDNDGRFEFVPVPTGPHALRLSVERVPLPWGLADEAPRKVDVPLRDAATVEIPLSRISQ